MVAVDWAAVRGGGVLEGLQQLTEPPCLSAVVAVSHLVVVFLFGVQTVCSYTMLTAPAVAKGAASP